MFQLKHLEKGDVKTGKVKSNKETMKNHAVVGLGKSQIKTRNASCNCEVSLTGQKCTSWNSDCTRAGEESGINRNSFLAFSFKMKSLEKYNPLF